MTSTSLHKVHRRGIAAGIAGVALAASLSLTGCSIAGALTGGGGSQGTSGDTGTGTGAVTGTGSVPATFPSDVPLISGPVFLGMDLGTGWSVSIEVDDAFTGYDEAKAKLLAAGFTAQVDTKSDKGAFGQFQGSTYSVNLTASTDPDPSPLVTYVVVKLG